MILILLFPLIGAAFIYWSSAKRVNRSRRPQSTRLLNEQSRSETPGNNNVRLFVQVTAMIGAS